MKPVEGFLFPRCYSMPSLVLAFRPRSCRSGMGAHMNVTEDRLVPSKEIQKQDLISHVDT